MERKNLPLRNTNHPQSMSQNVIFQKDKRCFVAGYDEVWDVFWIYLRVKSPLWQKFVVNDAVFGINTPHRIYQLFSHTLVSPGPEKRNVRETLNYLFSLHTLSGKIEVN